MKAVYLVTHPATPGLVTGVYPDDDDVTQVKADLVARGFSVNEAILSLTEDDIVLCRGGRRKVNDVDNPTGILPV